MEEFLARMDECVTWGAFLGLIVGVGLSILVMYGLIAFVDAMIKRHDSKKTNEHEVKK